MKTGKARFAELAALLMSIRLKRGRTQAEFAVELDVSQQAISRWEAGSHRPAIAQVPILAEKIGKPLEQLMTLAGYATPVAATPPAYFPVEALDPQTFERFVRDVVAERHSEADVRLMGAQGHEQSGSDILARFPDGQVWSFQVKRTQRFGAADVIRAVATHELKADRKFLVLSRVASPTAEAALAAHASWTLWDKQDLTHMIRRLPAETQDRLVDLYFRGQRMALLGRSEPGPWVDFQRYFAPYRGRSELFSHDWELVGREADVLQLVDLLTGSAQRVTLLIGAGGIGKTRLLREAIDRFAGAEPGTVIRFLSMSREPDAASLEALGLGEKLLVVDDAHDREGLGLLIDYAARPENRARLLIATRPYAEQRIRNELGLMRIVAPGTVRLDRLAEADLEALVVQVLEEFDGDHSWAEMVLAAASDSPLVAAMAAQVVAREHLGFELARSESGLRQIVLSRFTHVVTGNLGASADAPLLRAVLEVLAIIQPFHIDDRRIGELVAATKPGIAAGEVSRALRLLNDGGVIYRRGHLFRLMPDLLGDFLIEDSCIGADEQLTPFAHAVIREAPASQLIQILVNLGRMDWRLAGGDPSASALLAPIWRDLNRISDRYDPRLDAVEAAAFYQPGQALHFVQAQVDAGQRFDSLATILRRIAFSPEHRADALRLLWDLGREDERDLNPHPGHPVRVLAELISYDRQKPLTFVEEVAEFAFGLLDEPDAWAGAHSPLEVLDPLLSVEGTETRSTARTISLRPFFMDHDAIAHLRKRLIDRTLGLLEHESPRIARTAAIFVDKALRGPFGLLNSTVPDVLIARCNAEFADTISRLDQLVQARRVAPTTLFGIIRALSWHADHGTRALRNASRSLFRHLPDDLDFRFAAALTDVAEWQFIGQTRYDEWEENKDDWADSLVEDLLAQHEPSALVDLLLDQIALLGAVGEGTGNSGLLVGRLVAASSELRDEIVERSIDGPDTPVVDFLGVAVGDLLERSPEDGQRLIEQLLDEVHPRLRSGAARALIGLKRLRDATDAQLIARVIGTPEYLLPAIGIMAVRTWSDVSERQLIEFALKVPFDQVPALFDPFAMLICSRRKELLDHLTEVQVDTLLDRMLSLPALDGHWALEVLKQLAVRHGPRLARFLLDRAERALRDEEPGFEPVGYAIRRSTVGFDEAPNATAILRQVWAWLRQRDDEEPWVRARAAEMVATMFRVDSAPVIEFLDALLEQAIAADLRWMGELMRHAHHSFALKHRRLVQRLLERCGAISGALAKQVADEIYVAATSGGWSGIVGEPMPRDVKARDAARTALQGLSRLSPAYRLYRMILADAEANIRKTLGDAAAMDDEE